jgi:copper(I)-binding protein
MASLARVLLWLATTAAGSAAAAGPSVDDPWIRATPPGARTAAAYLTITNPGAADRLVAATTPAARSVELHTHVGGAGMSRMARLVEIDLPAGATVRLEPGGLHLMFIDIAGPLVPGAKVAVSLRFANGGTLDLDVPVVDARAASPTGPIAH